MELVGNSILLASEGLANLAHVLQEGRTGRGIHYWLKFGVVVCQHVGQQGFLVDHGHFEEVMLDLLVGDTRDTLDRVCPSQPTTTEWLPSSVDTCLRSNTTFR